MPGQRRILVTGATGTVGRQVVAQLLEAGAGVRALARDLEAACLPDGVEVVRGDLADPDTLHAPLDGVEAVFLLWPFATAESMPAVLDVVATHARRVVYLSSAAVRGYEQQIEQLVERSGLEWTFLRPHAFAANALRWAGQIRAEAVARGPYGTAAMPPLHERDLAAVAVRTLVDDGHNGAIYELTGPEILTQAEQASIIGEVIGRPVHWEETSPQVARQQMLTQGWPPAAVNGILQAQAEMVTAPRAATTTVAEVTGAPARTFRTWVTDHAGEFRDTMKAARIHEYGDASVIRYEEVPRPAAGPGEVLIRVAATSFNPSETALRSGVLRAVLPVDLPCVLGWDVSGTIAEVGDDVEGLAVGDRVIGRLDAGGAAAEYVAAPADVLAKAPATVPLTDAAAIPVAALTAWQALFEHAHITAGRRVLINGAGGGVGMFAVQLARHAGATVAATASGRSAAAVRRYGADQIIDYTTTALADALDGPVDAVVNLAPVSPEAAVILVSLLRPGGVIASVTTPVELPADADVTALHMVARNDTKQLSEIVELLDAGVLVVDVAESHPLSNLTLVHRRSEAGRTHGKITILP
ncbi:NmrA family NAD(P)-binding protein [Streptosporangium amethystogenes subsp. fukuiense]|uniref:NmrA family NAD(P)-binding protein n=1 Tax=Streptosporangium amethystogenes subsp. fukuiense TaxID=698418 RepID=A0ABW2SY18_9ACTN